MWNLEYIISVLFLWVVIIYQQFIIHDKDKKINWLVDNYNGLMKHYLKEKNNE